MNRLTALPMGAAIALFGLPVLAAELTDFVAAKDRAVSCWQRVYDSQHLANHPDQLVTQMTFGVVYHAPTSDYPEQFSFGMAASLRGGTEGLAQGPCYESDGRVQCGVECDGGNVILGRRDGGNLLVDLEAYGYIRMFSECGSDGEESAFNLEAGKDDKNFLLHPVSARICEGLVPEW